MRIHIPCISDQNIGGGYTFHSNFLKGMSKKYPEVEIVPETEPHDILFAFSPTTVNGETIQRSKQAGAKFILRMDGVPEDSRNSGRGTTRMIEYARQADAVIYQSRFIERTVGRILRENGLKCPTYMIYNGVDVDIFTPDGPKVNLSGEPKILHMAYRKDNNKRYEEVLAMYREYWTYNKQANLILIGRYPTEWQDYHMGFFSGEKVQRLGIMQDQAAKATFIRSCDLFFFPSYADPAPNSVLEALACGLPVIYNPYGGVAEYVGDAGVKIDIVNNDKYQTTYFEIIEEALGIKKVNPHAPREQALNFSLEIMAINYKRTFDIILEN